MNFTRNRLSLRYSPFRRTTKNNWLCCDSPWFFFPEATCWCFHQEYNDISEKKKSSVNVIAIQCTRTYDEKQMLFFFSWLFLLFILFTGTWLHLSAQTKANNGTQQIWPNFSDSVQAEIRREKTIKTNCTFHNTPLTLLLSPNSFVWLHVVHF